MVSMRNKKNYPSIIIKYSSLSYLELCGALFVIPFGYSIVKPKCALIRTSAAVPQFLARARGYKTFFVLNSIEHEILIAHKYKNIMKFGFF